MWCCHGDGKFGRTLVAVGPSEALLALAAELTPCLAPAATVRSTHIWRNVTLSSWRAVRCHGNGAAVNHCKKTPQTLMEQVLTRNIKDGLTICSQSDDSERRDKVNSHTFDLLKPQTAPFYLRFCCTKECATFICKENVFKKLSTNINSKSVAHAAKSKRTKSAAA